MNILKKSNKKMMNEVIKNTFFEGERPLFATNNVRL